MGDLFRLLRYSFIFLFVAFGLAIYSKAHAADDSHIKGSFRVNNNGLFAFPATSDNDCSPNYPGDGWAKIKALEYGITFVHSGMKYIYTVKKINFTIRDKTCFFNGEYSWGFEPPPEPPKDPCETPKTDEQCKKGQRRQVTLPKSFWSQSTAEHKGCVIAVESPGVGIANMGDDRATGHVNMMGSTGKSWCGDTGTSDTTAQSIGASGEFTPTTTPKDCPKGSVTMGGQSWCYTGASDGVTKPDGSVPDDGIHDNGTSDDGNGGDVDSSIDREPGEGGDGGGGDTGGGGDGSGGGTGDGNGISKGDIKDGVKEGVEEALGSKSGSPAPFVPPSVEGVEGGINGVMTRYKQRINASPVISAANNLRFSAPSSGCTPWSVHLDFLDQTVSFDQCNFLITNSEKVGYLMLAAYAIAALIIFLKA
ncbi:hypothetical protein OQ486_16240 [Plesiomonas shigelloides]|uniref:hypothetical protein n=1 Tax=Plesiomonas shigelloides TaxID=703 RepID=UPI002247073D|nr:hypothetical protein [Plesiomonas shigelloides]MCX2534995.1 hypothetical protein [Plesiomonas shigelloides]